jgi:hypothetical protein
VGAFALMAPSASAAQTVVSLTFDDGRGSQLSAVPYMNARGMRGTFFVNSGTVGTAGVLTYQQLRDLQAGGHEVGGHTIDHVDMTTLNTADKQHQACDDRTALLGQGLNATSFAYPYGKYDSSTGPVVQSCGYSSARTAGGVACNTCPAAETIPPVEPFATRAIDSIFYTTTLDQMKGYVTRAESSGGGWLQFVFHDICNSCDPYSITEANFAGLVDWLAPRAATGTVVKTVRSVIEGDSGPPPPPPPPTDTTPPTVAITSPTSGATLRGNVKITASASDTQSAISKVDFLVDGTLLASDTSAPYATPWNARKYALGQHRLTAVATDAAGNSASASVTVTVAR